MYDRKSRAGTEAGTKQREAPMKTRTALLSALLTTAYPIAANADLLLSQFPVTERENGDSITFAVTNTSGRNLLLDFTLAVIQGAAPLSILGDLPEPKSIPAGATVDYTYTGTLPGRAVTFFFEASNIPGARDYQEFPRRDRDQYAAVIEGAVSDHTTWELMGDILSDVRGGPTDLMMTELYPASANRGSFVFGAIADPVVGTEPAVASMVPEPALGWLAWLIVPLGLVGFHRQRRRGTLSASPTLS
jgi:hypothetical protein